MDAMELAAARHGCKVCGKSFPCGRSLGGHMRSHLTLGEATAEADAHDETKHDSANFGRSSNGVVGYGLRENPRKTRRLSDFADEEEDDDGGDGDGDGEHKACRQCGKLFGSWRSLFGHMRSHASGGRDRYEEDVDIEAEFIPEEADAEEVEMEELMEAPVLAPAPVAVLAAAPRRRRRTMRVAAPAPAPPAALSGFEKEQEDVALCLLMLSRDTGQWSSPVREEPLDKERENKNATRKQARLPRNGYAYNSDDDSALLQYGDAKIKSGGGVAKGRKRISPKQQCQPAAAAPKRTRYECPGCGKVFSSYQALGGHRASHKRINTSCSAPKQAAPVPAPEPRAETYTSFSTLSPSASPDSVVISIGGDRLTGKAKASAVVEKFKCPICFKVFASGQALGGHKRSHVLANDGDLYDAGADQEERHTPVAAGFLDLNFPPAPAEEA